MANGQYVLGLISTHELTENMARVTESHERGIISEVKLFQKHKSIFMCISSSQKIYISSDMIRVYHICQIWTLY